MPPAPLLRPLDLKRQLLVRVSLFALIVLLLGAVVTLLEALPIQETIEAIEELESLGLPIGIAYGVWAACGVALTAIFARLFLREPLTRTMACGILVIVVGVWLVEAGH